MKPETKEKLEKVISVLGVPFLLKISDHNKKVIKHKEIEKEVEELRNDKEFLFPFLKTEKDSALLSLVSTNLKKDEEFCLESIKHSPSSISFCALELRNNNNEDFLLKALKVNPNCLEYITDPILHDPKFQIKAVKITPKILAYATPPFERDVVLEAVKLDGNIIKYSYTHYMDREILFLGMENSKDVLQYIPGQIRKDQKFIEEMIKYKAWNYQHAIDKSNRDLIILALQQENEEILQYLPKKKLKDPEIIKLALKNDPSSLKYLAKQIEFSKEDVLKIIKKFKSSRKYLNGKHKKDKEIQWMSMGYYKWIFEVENFDLNFQF